MEKMDKKTKIREYKETPRLMGLYQIKNKVNGKILIGSSVNLPAILNGNFSIIVDIPF